MATKLAETQKTTESLQPEGFSSGVSTRTDWLSRLVKRRIVNRVVSLCGDALALVVAHWAAQDLIERLLHIPPSALTPPNYAVFYLPFLLAVLVLFERNQRPDLRRPEKEFELAVKGVSFAFLLLVCANFVVFKTGFSRYLMVSWYLFTVIALLAIRYGLRLLYGTLWRRGIGQKRTLLVGSAGKLFELQTLLTIQRYRGYDLLGIVPAATDTSRCFDESKTLQVLGPIEQWHEIAEGSCAEQVIVALDENTAEAHSLVSDILKRCLTEGIDVQIYSDLFASREFNYEMDEFSGFFRFFAAPRWSRQAQMVTKAALDVLAGVVGALIALAASPVVGLAIKIEDGGPIFYRREFVDRDGSVRYYLKFRTMHVNGQEILDRNVALKAKFEEKHKLSRDPRVTRVGQFLRKYSIDEFPQFFSLLQGKLALVGPRVISREEAKRYGNELPKLLTVKPGMTGFWQVMGRQLTTYQERIQMDMFYIDHWSIWLDLWIVAKTFVKVIMAEGAY